MANRFFRKTAARRRKRTRTSDPQRTRLALERLEDRRLLAGEVTIKGLKFYDLNGDSLRDANEPGLSGWTIFVDADNSTDFSTGDPFAVTDSQGNYSISGVPGGGNIVVREQLRPGWEQKFPRRGFYSFGATPGETVTGIDFGNRISDRALFGEIHGRVCNDADQNGSCSVSEPGIEGWQIYLDQNNNAQFDADERWTFTASDGSYAFGKLLPITYTVREVNQAGWQQSFPGSASHSVTIEERKFVNDVDFGNYLVSPGEIRGVKWNDTDGNGLLDQNESPLPGVKIFLDDNHNGQVDANEPFAVTDAQGAYSLSNVFPGPHTVTELLPDLWRQNFPGIVKDFVPSPIDLIPFAPPNATAEANGVFAGDFDKNGQLDLAAFDAARGVVSLMMNQGHGRFASPEEVPVGTGIKFVLFGDVNNDSAPDIVTVANVTEGMPSAKHIQIVTRLHDGTNEFPIAFTLQLDGVADAGTLAEINHDGNLDLLLTRFLKVGDVQPVPSVLLNNGAGAFSVSDNAILREASGGSVIARDFDRDGFVDLVNVVTNADQLEYRRNLRNGTFAAPVILSEEPMSHPAFVTAGDLDGNGFLDLVVANEGFGSNVHRLSVFLNTGGGNFSAEVGYDTGAPTVAAALADFDGERGLDIVLANKSTDSVSVLLNNGSGAFGAATDFSVGIQPVAIAAGDWNLDGQVDLAVGNSSSKDLSILLNTSGGGGLSFAADVKYAVGGAPVSLTSGYLDGDADLDLITVVTDQFGKATKRELLNNGDGTFAAAQDLTYDRTNRKLTVADFTGDGYADWIEVPDFTHDILFYLNAGNGVYAAPTHIDIGSRPSFVTAGDVNGDGRLDLSVALLESNNIVTLLNDGSGNFTSKGATSLGHPPIDIIGRDLNGDGRGDWVSISGDGGFVSWLKSRGDGTYDPVQDFSAVGTGVITSGDLNGDGHVDLVTALLGNNLGVQYNSISPDFGHGINVVPGGSLANQDFGNQRLSWKNPGNALGVNSFLDVNDDGAVAPQDALIVINYLNDRGAGRLDPAIAFTKPYYDVNGDDNGAPDDVLLIINFLNGAGGEGEGSAAGEGAGPSGAAAGQSAAPHRSAAAEFAFAFDSASPAATSNSEVNRGDVVSGRAAEMFVRAVDLLWSQSANVAAASLAGVASNPGINAVDARLRQLRHELLTNDLDALLAELAADLGAHRRSS